MKHARLRSTAPPCHEPEFAPTCIHDHNSPSIGHTPLVRLNRIAGGAKATVLARIKGRNPAYAVKCRIGAALLWEAEKRGLLGPGKEIIEPTRGNTGIALAFVAAARGYPITMTMPEDHEHRTAQAAAGLRRQVGTDRRCQGHERRRDESRGDRCHRPWPLCAAAVAQ
jgi:threonine dehydratase